MGILQFFQKIRNIRNNGVASSELRKPTISNQTQSTKSDLSNELAISRNTGKRSAKT